MLSCEAVAVTLPGRRALVALAGSAGVGMVLAGCGFALRRAPELRFRSLGLQGFERGSPLVEELRRQISPQVQVLVQGSPGPAGPEVVLQALVDRQEKSVVASTAAAQVRELQLRVKFEFRATTASGRELIPPTELLLTRDMSYRETLALAKEQEEAELLREMTADIAGQVLRRLATLLV